MAGEDLIVGLDIGTTKVCAIIGEFMAASQGLSCRRTGLLAERCAGYRTRSVPER